MPLFGQVLEVLPIEAALNPRRCPCRPSLWDALYMPLLAKPWGCPLLSLSAKPLRCLYMPLLAKPWRCPCQPCCPCRPSPCSTPASLVAPVGQVLAAPLPALLPLSAKSLRHPCQPCCPCRPSPCDTPASLVAPVGKDPSSQGAIPLMTLLLLYAVLLLLLPPLRLWSEGADGGEEAWLGHSAHSQIVWYARAPYCCYICISLFSSINKNKLLVTLYSPCSVF